MSQPSAKVQSERDLLEYFHGAETPREEFRVGTEHEKIGIDLETGTRVPYAGERGIGELLSRIAAEDNWKPIFEGEHVIALEKEGASITLEPGGQIELSGAPLRTARETCREFNGHVDLVNRLSEDMGFVWLALGVDPLHSVDEIPKMPKARYDIMRAYLPTRGSLGLEMMHASAAVQANFDYSSEADMVSKMRVGMSCTSLVSAIFANSSISGGRENGYATRRVAIWRDTDPDRCGLLHFVFDEDFGYRRYLDWALDIPLFFVVRDGHYRSGGGMTFREFMREGFEGEPPTVKDWDTQLTTLFPEVRLKRIIEVRGADAVPRDLTCALPALWKGLFYDDDAGRAALALTAGVSREVREAAQEDVARRGLAAELGGRAVLDLARELVAIAAEGLRRIAERGETDADERFFLEPVEAVLERGKSPGEQLVEQWRGALGGSPRRLIEYARY